MSDRPLIRFEDSEIGDGVTAILSGVNWEMERGEAWVITGENGSGKSVLAAAIAGELQASGFTRPGLGDGDKPAAQAVALVSFEKAIALIERELRNDDSDFVEGGVDEGTSVWRFLLDLPPEASAGSTESARRDRGWAERHPAVAACGLLPILDRGLKRLSTGEIRRTLLARALISSPKLIILDEPGAGLDAASREILDSLLERLALRATAGARESGSSEDGTGNADGAEEGLHPPVPLLVLDRWAGVPPGFNRVLALCARKIVFTGTREAYERGLAGQGIAVGESKQGLKNAPGLPVALPGENAPPAEGGVPLVQMRGVTVQWGENRVIDNLSWTVRAGEHWLVRGPNGSGKTTILELISGDNPQVFRNDVRLFGRRRGTGETIWELKQRMGIVSWRLHLDYRSLDDSSLEEVLVSGLHDSIGMYERMGDAEILLAGEWLNLALLGGRGRERFGRLSYGEQRALLVARAAIKGPELLILDEPCHGLDEAHRDRVLALLEAIAARGRSTLLHVTHDPSEVLSAERRILELRPGESPMYRLLTR